MRREGRLPVIDNRLLQYADSLAEATMKRAEKAGLTQKQALQASVLTLRLMAKAFPGSILEVIDAMNEADATFAAHTLQEQGKD